MNKILIIAAIAGAAYLSLKKKASVNATDAKIASVISGGFYPSSGGETQNPIPAAPAAPSAPAPGKEAAGMATFRNSSPTKSAFK